MFKQPLLMSGVLWLGMAIAATRASDVRNGDQTAAQPTTGRETVTIVGCLVQGDPELNAGQQPADTGAPPEGDFFVRTRAIQVPVGTTLTVGGSGAAAADTPVKMALYRVMGLSRDELRPHLNHRVEVQGSLRSDDKALGITTRTTVEAGGRPTTSVDKRMNLAGALQATAIKMISADCE